MAVYLIFLIYVSFIGLGLPDSLFGAAWPAIYSEFNLPISFGSFVTVITAGGTVTSSLMSARVIKLLGTGRVAALSTALTAVGILGFSLTGSFLPLCIFAVPLGIGAGAIDAALNNYVATHYSAAHMSFLHCFYGIGVSVSPFILSRVMSGAAGWRGGYRITFYIQLAIALLLIVSIPVWKKVNGGDGDSSKSEKNILALPLREVAKIRGVKPMWCLFISSCAIEFTCGSWGSTFLVEYKHLAADAAAGMMTFYYVGIAAGRFLSGMFSSKLGSWTIIRIGQIVLGAAVVLLFIPGGGGFAAACLFLVGLGNGPLFPNFNYLAPQSFGDELSPSVIGTQMSAANLSIMLAPVLFSFIAQQLGLGIFPLFLLAFYILMAAASLRAQKVLIKK